MVLKLTDGKYTEIEHGGGTDLVVMQFDTLRNTDRNVIPNYLIALSFEELFQSIPGVGFAGA